MNEFELIKQFFYRPHSQTTLHPLPNGDDAAITRPPADYDIVTSIDCLVEGRHFLADASPEDIGYKSLAVSLSDMAAMGANPISLVLGITLPNNDKTWLNAFTQGMKTLLDAYEIDLIGGDTTKGPLTIATVVNGLIPMNKALTRSGAKVGDSIYVTGQVGDAAKALQLLQANQPCDAELLQKLTRPTPRIATGIALRDIANSMIDISDGLAQDLQHILAASHCGAIVYSDQIPTQQELGLALTGGDDFELCFTAPTQYSQQISAIAEQQNLAITCIGEIVTGSQLSIIDSHGQPLTLQLSGYQHFSDADET